MGEKNMSAERVGSKSKATGWLVAFQIIQTFRFWQALRAIETLPAFAATIGPIRQEKHHPKFQQAPPFGAMHMVAATSRAISIFRINEETELAFHWQGMIAPGDSVRNRPGHLFAEKAMF